MPEIDKRSSQTVNTDRWDRADYAAVRQELREVPAATDALLEITPTARPEMSDIFALMYKAAPDLKDLSEIRDDHRINYNVNSEVLTLPDIQELHRYTRGDKVGAAMALVKMEPDLEVIFDRQKHNQSLADRLQELRQELMEKLQELAERQEPGEGEGENSGGEGSSGSSGADGEGDGEDQSDGDSQGNGSGSLEQEVEALEQAIKALEQALEQGTNDQQIRTRASLQQAIRGAAEEARSNYENAVTWGVDPGKLRRLPADVRLKMAKQLNNPRLRAIAEQFGPMRNIAMSSKIRIVPGLPQEVIGVTLGNEVARLTPSELLRFADEDQELRFLLDFAERRLQQYKMHGKEKVGKGGIIYCADCSGSMTGQREIWAKALGLVLLNIAKIEHREFHWINFGSPNVFQIVDFTEPAHFTMEGILRVAEMFEGGGTAFDTPLREALKILKTEFNTTGKVESDIVFATDGECDVSPSFLAQFLEDLHAIDGAVWGVQIGGSYSHSTLDAFCEGKVTTVDQFTAEGSRSLHNIFKHVRGDKDK